LFIRTKQASNEPANLTFICTHNSRRSHMSQLWAATAAAWYGVKDVGTFSGGTEATAFNPRAVAALQRAGFVIENPGGDNPHYRVAYGPGAPVMECYSKTYDDPSNPQKGFAAVMTCSQADKNCPVVMGAALRVAIPYDDPKAADGTPDEAQRYDERCNQIATEMFYLFSQVNA
jgi:arsenate reductase